MAIFSAADIPADWRQLLGNFFESTQWQHLQVNMQNILERDENAICPKPENFFKALSLTPLSNVKVVILGQDPYHSPSLAQGLAFSIPNSIAINSRQFPSSLRNISKALAIEGFGSLTNGDLHHWAEQGVLLLNTALSVKQGEAGSHVNLGWRPLIDQLIFQLAHSKPNLVWMLWGGHAQSKLPLIESGINQLILKSSHPSGLGVYKTTQPFLKPGDAGSCQHFTKANHWLMEHGQTPISWINQNKEVLAQTAQSDLFG